MAEKYQFSESAEEMHAKALELESKTKPIWLTITDHEGVIGVRLDIAEYDLSKSLARNDLVDDIKSAADKIKKSQSESKVSEG